MAFLKFNGQVMREYAKPVDEPWGVRKWRWNTWYTMHAVHQSRRSVANDFNKLSPLDSARFL